MGGARWAVLLTFLLATGVEVDAGCRKLVRQMQAQLEAQKQQLSQIVDVLAPAEKTSTCPEDFTYIAAINGCYKVVLDNLQVPVAALRCRSLHKDAHLVFINNATEKNHVADMLAKYSDAETAHCHRWHSSAGAVFWTGAHRSDPLQDSAFVWKKSPFTVSLDDMLEMTYSNWHNGEPNGGAFPDPEACAAMFRSSNFAWVDWLCRVATCSVCELDL